MTAVELRLLPKTSAVSADGVLSIGGIAIPELAKEFGTPLFVYDEEHLRTTCQEAVKAFGVDSVIYATKAFLCTALARLVHEEGVLLDVLEVLMAYVDAEVDSNPNDFQIQEFYKTRGAIYSLCFFFAIQPTQITTKYTKSNNK